MYFLIALVIRSLPSQCWQGHTPYEGSRGESFLGSFRYWWLHAFLRFWLHYANIHLNLYMVFSFFVSSMSLIRTFLIGFRARLDNPELFHLDIINDMGYNLFSK